MVFDLLALFLPLVVLGVVWRWPAERAQVLWGGLFGLPFVALQYLVAGEFDRFGTGPADIVWTILALVSVSFCFGALAAVGYERVVNRYLTPMIHVRRRRLWWLAIGLVIAIGFAVSGTSVLLAGMIGLFVSALVVVALSRAPLLWDALMSAVGLGLWYGVMELFVGLRFSGDLHLILQNQDPLGITIGSVPLEVLLVAVLGGALLGPLFAATKHHRARGRVAATNVTTAKIICGSVAVMIVMFILGWGINEFVVAPKIVSMNPTATDTNVMTDTAITFVFNRPVDRNTLRLDMNPAVDGTWDFGRAADGRHGFRVATFHFATTLLPDTEYRGWASGVQSVWGLTAPVVAFHFRTRQLTDIAGLVVPNNQAANEPVFDPCQPLAVSFANAYDPASQFSAQLTPAVPVTVTVDSEGRGLRLQPDVCLASGRTYTLQINRQLVVRDPVTDDVVQEEGLMTVYETLFRTTGGSTTTGTVPSVLGVTQAVGLSGLTTIRQQKILPIAVDYQDKPLSCEAAALKMALAGEHVKTTETAIMKYIGFDPTPHRGNVWGDPNVAFVGNIDGRQNTTGYGVHWQPIARAAQHWRPAMVVTNLSTVRLASELAAGHPVVIWGTLGTKYRTDWFTPSGRIVHAWKGEHARTVIGFYGPETAPTYFVLNDPVVGRVTWSRATLESNWASYGASGVIVQ